MSKFGIFLFSILIFWEIVECMDNKGKGKVGEESSGQEGGASSQGRRGGSRRSHAHIPTRESEPTQNWNEEHEMGPTEGHAPNLDDEIQNQHELLMQERLMHLQQHTEMINQLQNATERLNLPQELRRNLRIKPEKLMQNMQKKNKKIVKLQNEREKSLKKKENAIYDQGRENYLDNFEFSKEMRQMAKENKKEMDEFLTKKMAELRNFPGK
ncbi:unnamed protein product [Meloidogyne enterolobii]|uniref:Uncharacterized protein n=1 Tax=Meloidogyne enterolobii TaxID=390850 RepID=A0ACB1AT42_MELEN